MTQALIDKLDSDQLAAIATWVHDLLRLYEVAAADKAVAVAPPAGGKTGAQAAPPSPNFDDRASGLAFAIAAVGETLCRLGGEPLLRQVAETVEHRFGVPSAIILASCWRGIPRR